MTGSAHIPRISVIALLLVGGASGCNCGTVLRAAAPKISVSPTSLEFDSVTIGTTATQTLNVTNVGLAPLVVSAVTVQSSNDITVPVAKLFATDCMSNPRDAGVPITIPAGNCAQIVVQYAPKATETGVMNKIIIDSNDPTEKVATVSVKASSAQRTCGGTNSPIAKIAVMNGNSAVSGSVLPLTMVTLNGAGSTAPSGTHITTYAWKLTAQPPNNMSMLSSTSGSSTGLMCSLAGTYTVQLTVTASNGCTGTQNVNISVIPGAGLHVELTWPETYGDLDLHYVGPGGTFYDHPRDDSTAPGMGSDLYFPYAASEFDGTTFTQNATQSIIDWGLNGTTQPDYNTMDDPTLDVDQVWGKGPENVTHAHPFAPENPYSYSVMVHYYCSSAYDQVLFGGESTSELGSDANCGTGDQNDGKPCKDFGPTTANITVYFNGNAIWTGSQQMTAKQIWTAATIVVGNNGAAMAKVSSASITKSTHGCPDGL